MNLYFLDLKNNKIYHIYKAYWHLLGWMILNTACGRVHGLIQAISPASSKLPFSLLTTHALFQIHKWTSFPLASGPLHMLFPVPTTIQKPVLTSYPTPPFLGLVNSYFSLKPRLITSLVNFSHPLDHVNSPIRGSHNTHMHSCLQHSMLFLHLFLHFSLYVWLWLISDSPICPEFLWGRAHLFFLLIAHCWSTRANHKPRASWTYDT